MEPSFISEYKALYGELHNTPSQSVPHIKKIDERIVRITKSIKETPRFSEATSISADDVKALSSSEVEDVNRLARETLWNESGLFKKIIIKILRFFTFGSYTGVHQIPVAEFTASVTKYLEKTEQLKNFLKPIPVAHEGFLESCNDLATGKCYYLWKNSDANNALVLSVFSDDGLWTHFACSFSEFASDKVTLTNFQNENDKVTLFVHDLDHFEEEVESRMSAPPYGKIRFEEVMGSYVTELPLDNYPTILGLLRSCDVLKKKVVAMTREGSDFVVATRNPEGQILHEKLSVNSYGVVTLRNDVTGQVRSFPTIEQFKNSYFTLESMSVKEARRFINLGERGRMLVTDQKKLIHDGAELLSILQSPQAVHALKREIEGQLLYLGPSRCGGFIYETSDPQVAKVVYATDEGVVEEDIQIRDKGVIYKGKGFPLNTPLNIILDWESGPFVPMEEARASITRILKDGVSIEELSERLRKNQAFCLPDRIDDILKNIYSHTPDKGKLAGLYIIIPPAPKARGWLDYFTGDYDQTFSEFALCVYNGKELERLPIKIDPKSAANPYVYMAKHYPTPEAILQEQRANLRFFKPYKHFIPKVIEQPAPKEPRRVVEPPVQPKAIEPAKPAEPPKAKEGPGILGTIFSDLFGSGAATPTQPKPSAVEKPAPVAHAPEPPKAAPSAVVDTALRQYRGELTNPTTKTYYSMTAKAAIKPRQALLAEIATWMNGGIKLSRAQADEALSNLLLNRNYSESYPNLASILSLRMQDVPSQGGKASRDAILTWIWNQK